MQPGYWALVPAAGSGIRMGADRPKQYLPLQGRAVLLHTLERLCTHPRIKGVLLGLAPGDPYWPGLSIAFPRLLGTFSGGAERALTVLNGLHALAGRAQPDDWVLVHDAVRPCLRHMDIDALIDQASLCPDGGLLGVALTDTVKRADREQRVVETVERGGLWRALTPQMFRLQALRAALEAAVAAGVNVTDEATAIERVGGRPLLVAGHADNIKITVPADLTLAEMYLKQQGV
jgi:2-C-methyl-D-erythritol 4-phosphate cytidylyltransferase